MCATSPKDGAPGRSACCNDDGTRPPPCWPVVYVVATLALGYRDLTPLVVMAVGIGLNRDWIALGNEKGARSAAPAAVQGILLVTLALFASSASPSFAPAVAYGAGLVLSIILNPLPPREPEGVAPDQVDGWMLLAVLSNQVMSSADTLLLAFFASASVAGIYAAVYRLPNGWLALLVIVRGSLLPLATSVRREHPDQMGALRRSSMRWSCLSSLVLIAAMPVVYWLHPGHLRPRVPVGSVAGGAPAPGHRSGHCVIAAAPPLPGVRPRPALRLVPARPPRC